MGSANTQKKLQVSAPLARSRTDGLTFLLLRAEIGSCHASNQLLNL